MKELSASQIDWLRRFYVIGEHKIFAEMQDVKERIQRETQKTRELIHDEN